MFHADHSLVVLFGLVWSRETNLQRALLGQGSETINLSFCLVSLGLARKGRGEGLVSTARCWTKKTTEGTKGKLGKTEHNSQRRGLFTYMGPAQGATQEMIGGASNLESMLGRRSNLRSNFGPIIVQFARALGYSFFFGNKRRGWLGKGATTGNILHATMCKETTLG